MPACPMTWGEVAFPRNLFFFSNITKRKRQRKQGGAFMIQKVKGGYKVVSESGKNLGGPYKTKAAAQKRLRQVEYFKHRKKT